MKVIKNLTFTLLISLLLNSCSPYEWFDCDVICSIEESDVDCECPDICYNLSSPDYEYMRLNGDDIVSLGETYTIDEGMATIEAATSAISAAWVNVYGPDDVKIGSFSAYPSNYGDIDSVQLVLDSGFVFPVEVSYYRIGSWWNSAYLTELSLCGINEKL